MNDHDWGVDDILIITSVRYGTHIWRILGIYLGGQGQEDVIEIQTLGQTINTQGARIYVPRVILNASSNEAVIIPKGKLAFINSSKDG